MRGPVMRTVPPSAVLAACRSLLATKPNQVRALTPRICLLLLPRRVVVEARNLKSSDTLSKNDPYVNIVLPGSTQTHKVYISAVCSAQDPRSVMPCP
jgi:hypothetical protein